MERVIFFSGNFIDIYCKVYLDETVFHGWELKPKNLFIYVQFFIDIYFLHKDSFLNRCKYNIIIILSHLVIDICFLHRYLFSSKRSIFI